jgi:DNA-directed RNA polymerase I and III subunit RPAC1
MPHLNPQLETIRTRVFINNNAPEHTATLDEQDAFRMTGYSNTLTLDSFRSKLAIDIVDSSDEHIVFDLVGVAPPVANALRRILLAEVPTIAIEKVIFFQNTSIIADEVLAHRIGLVPLRVDPRLFQFLHENPNNQPNELNTLVFTLDIKCTRRSGGPSANEVLANEIASNNDKYENSLVMSGDLKWEPQGRQASIHSNIEPTEKDIVLAKLRPGQSIEAELHAIKGTGAQHAKWSPVATASYRLLPEIVFTEPIVGEDAFELVKKCPMNVFDIEDLGADASSSRNWEGQKDRLSKIKPKNARAYVARPRDCSMCRECIRAVGWEERINLRRVRDHYIFSVETTGAYSPEEVVMEAFDILQKKAKVLSKAARTAHQEISLAEKEEKINTEDAAK